MEKTFNPGKSEPRIFKKWESSGCFRAGANAKKGAKTFCIMIPPPNVTGSLHMGHAFNNTLQDILVRWHRMRGYDTLWQPGQDHAGIATQMVVERQLLEQSELSRHQLGREGFLKKVWEWKEQSGGTIIQQLKRLGASCDWSRNRFTMDPGFHDAVLKVFVELYEKGLIYKGRRLVNWDPDLETAISDLEVEQIEKQGSLWRLRYPLDNGLSYDHPTEFDENSKPIAFQTRNFLVVATTRPETMLGDTAIAVNKKDARYAHLIGKTVSLPLVNRSIPIIADDYANPLKGTGAVKITPAHDFNDWDVGKRNNLRAVNVFNARAEIQIKNNLDFLFESEPNAEVLELDGLERYQARKKIIRLAEEQGWLDGIDEETHIVPHGDRSGVAIEPLLTHQWFVDTKKIVEPAIMAVRSGKTKIIPEQDSKVYFNWLESIEPWCISRQLWWGHQIPVWYDNEGNQYCAESEEKAKELAKGKSLIRDQDVLDTWFSSGIWPIGTLGWPNKTEELGKYFPTDILVTGFDIIFFWVARMMMMQLALVEKVPFHTVYVHALVRDEKGKKMSKSKGNVLDPIELIDEYGADAVRFTLTSMAAMGRDLKLSKNRIAGYRNFGTKLWNAARFAEINDCKPDENFTPHSVNHTLNKWIVGETARFKEKMDKSLENFRFNDAAAVSYNHIWGKFCDWYVEFSKPLLEIGDPDTRAETQSTLAWVLDQCLILLHPIMPFITEELWSKITHREKPLIHTDWPDYSVSNLLDQDADHEIAWVINLIEQIRSVRSELGVPPAAKVPLVQIQLDKRGVSALNRNSALIERLSRLSKISIELERQNGAVIIPVEGGEFALKIANFIDLPSEKSRLKKSINKIIAEVNLLEKKLSNQKFIANAPSVVIDESKSRLLELQNNLSKLSISLEQIRMVG